MKKSVLNAMAKALLITARRMKGAARRATDLASSQMMGKILKRCGIRIPAVTTASGPDQAMPDAGRA